MEGGVDLRVLWSGFLHPHPATAASLGRVQAEVERRRKGEEAGGAAVCGLRPAAQGSQPPRSVLSRDRLLVFRGDTGLGGLLRLELLEAVECLGESESSPSKSLAGASLPWSMPPEDSEPSDGEGMGCRFAL